MMDPGAHTFSTWWLMSVSTPLPTDSRPYSVCTKSSSEADGRRMDAMVAVGRALRRCATQTSQRASVGRNRGTLLMSRL